MATADILLFSILLGFASVVRKQINMIWKKYNFYTQCIFVYIKSLKVTVKYLTIKNVTLFCLMKVYATLIRLWY